MASSTWNLNKMLRVVQRQNQDIVKGGEGDAKEQEKKDDTIFDFSNKILRSDTFLTKYTNSTIIITMLYQYHKKFTGQLKF